jgi:hypothetical protein
VARHRDRLRAARRLPVGRHLCLTCMGRASVLFPVVYVASSTMVMSGGAPTLTGGPVKPVPRVT